MPEIGNNVSYEVSKDNKKLTITVDLSKQIGLSTSQKNMKIATTGGNQTIALHDGKGQFSLGVNVYKPKA